MIRKWNETIVVYFNLLLHSLYTRNERQSENAQIPYVEPSWISWVRSNIDKKSLFWLSGMVCFRSSGPYASPRICGITTVVIIHETDS